VDQFDLTVSGPPRAAVPLTADPTFSKTASGLSVTMKPDKPLQAGAELTLNFYVNDAQTGKPATDLQKYLGELAHFVVISQDLKQFLHVHPMSGGGDHDEMPGMKHDEMGGMKHDGAKPAGPAPTVSAHTTFPGAGLFKLWAQFQRNGQVITVPFTVNVAAGAKAKAGISNGKSQMPDAVKITVSKDGYTPASVTVKAGQPVKLAFYRADAQNCGSEVVFPKLNLRKKLPVGQTVLVELTPQEAGELTFACGMNMMRGKVIVQ
jgi:plastocyanin